MARARRYGLHSFSVFKKQFWWLVCLIGSKLSKFGLFPMIENRIRIGNFFSFNIVKYFNTYIGKCNIEPVTVDCNPDPTDQEDVLQQGSNECTNSWIFHLCNSGQKNNVGQKQSACKMHLYDVWNLNSRFPKKIKQNF